MSPHPREIELKLEVEAPSLTRLKRSSLMRAAATKSPKPKTLVSVYFDTDKLKLRNKGLSLRVRRAGRRYVQTIKQETGATRAVFDRNEWEREIATKQPDLEAARKTALEPLLNKKLRRNLKPLFATRVRRTVYPIHSRDGQIELTIDKGSVAANGHSSPLFEVELELKSGKSAELFKLARALAEEVPVHLAIKSKAERGYALVTGEKPVVVKAVPVAIAPQSNAKAAFQAIAGACLRQLLANRPLMQTEDPEALHQMRVALRRMRAAISLFSPMVACPETNAIKAELKWITGELGPARELDVFVKRVVKPVGDCKPHGPGIAVLTTELRRRRADAQVRAKTAVESARFRTLVLATAEWIECGDWTRNDELVSAERERPIGLAAADELRRRWKKIIKRGARLCEIDPRLRHKLRIQSKKLRYASEFFAGVFPGKKASRRREDFVAALEKLQDALGDLNDIAVHEELTEQFVNGHDDMGRGRRGRAKKAFAAGRLSGHEEVRATSVLKATEKAYDAFTRVKPFWQS